MTPRWRPELAREIAEHRAIGMPVLAVLLQLSGVDTDLSAPAYLIASRHWRASPDGLCADSPACAECARLTRMQQYLLGLVREALAPLGLSAGYITLRSAVARRLDVTAFWPDPTEVPRQFRALLQRFQTDDLLEACLATMWIVRRYYARTHAPGALTARWQSHYGDRLERKHRLMMLQDAWCEYAKRTTGGD